MPETITSLIEKLEGAGSGSAALDREIARLFGWHRVEPRHASNKHGGWIAPEDFIGTYSDGSPKLDGLRGTTIHRDPYRFTTSLDAALGLTERVLTLGAWDVGYYYNSDRPHYARLVIVRDDEGQPEIYGRSATPALALCVAVLRAQSEARATGEDSPANEGEGV
ncbi:hypothetical protein [Brevundimonas vesicularis]|uniref:hypothetical protein n=1 Tax=Brevundimonas vesicularis TaxID=41276 RepID=UPI0028AC4F79|nr:hypothetical protein [Brevundimonas vesicularis]